MLKMLRGAKGLCRFGDYSLWLPHLEQPNLYYTFHLIQYYFKDIDEW